MESDLGYQVRPPKCLRSMEPLGGKRLAMVHSDTQLYLVCANKLELPCESDDYWSKLSAIAYSCPSP